jgi:hypothetical protein
MEDLHISFLRRRTFFGHVKRLAIIRRVTRLHCVPSSYAALEEEKWNVTVCSIGLKVMGLCFVTSLAK